MSCKCVDDVKVKEKQIEYESFAMTLIKECSKSAKRWFITSLVVLTMWLITVGAFVWYLNQYDFVTIENETGTSNYIGGSGDIINGND